MDWKERISEILKVKIGDTRSTSLVVTEVINLMVEEIERRLPKESGQQKPADYLSGAELDWAVAEDLGMTWPTADIQGNFHPSTSWEDGGPIIERERISIKWEKVGDGIKAMAAIVNPHSVIQWHIADTLLVAAMRAFVDSRRKIRYGGLRGSN